MLRSSLVLTFITLVCNAGLAQQQVGRSAISIDAANLLTRPSVVESWQGFHKPANFFAQNLPLRVVVQNFSANYRVGIWLDRRIDPNTAINYAGRAGETVQEALQQVARLAGAEFCYVENVGLVCPKDEGSKIQAAAVRLHNALTKASVLDSSQIKVGRRLVWKELATPTEVLEEIAGEWGVEIDGQLPYDLLHAGELPADSALATHLAILSGGFGIYPSLNPANRIELTNSPGVEVTWQASYPQEWLTVQAAAELNRARGQVRRAGNTWEVTGETDFHYSVLKEKKLMEAAAEPPFGRRSVRGDARKRDVEKRWSGELANTLEKLVVHLAESNGVAVQWNEELTDRQRGQYVRVTLENDTLDQIFQRIASAAQVTIQLDGDQVRVRP